MGSSDEWTYGQGQNRDFTAIYEEKAEDKGRCLEILFHPGSLLEEEAGEEFVSEGAKQFYLSDGRRIEKNAVMSMRTEEK